jgi:hypothetical protein
MTCERYTSWTFAEDRHRLRQLNDSPVSKIKVDKPFPSIKNNWLGVTGKPGVKVSLVFRRRVFTYSEFLLWSGHPYLSEPPPVTAISIVVL